MCLRTVIYKISPVYLNYGKSRQCLFWQVCWKNPMKVIFVWTVGAVRVPQWYWVDKIADHPDVRSITSWLEVVVLISLCGSLAKGARKDWPKSVETTLGSQTLVCCLRKIATGRARLKVNDNLMTLSVAKMNEIWVWIIGVMILTRKKSSARRKSCPSSKSPTTNSTWTGWGQTRVSVEKDRRITA